MKSIYELQKELEEGSEEVWAFLKELSTIVQKKHYPTYADPEDLIGDGIVKGVELIQEDRLHGQYRSLRSYLYTGMRNTMSNRLYRESREGSVPLEEIVEMPVQDIEERLVSTRDFVNPVFEQMPDPYKVYFGEVNRFVNTLSRGERIDITEPAPTLKERNLERLLALSLWSINQGLSDLAWTRK